MNKNKVLPIAFLLMISLQGCVIRINDDGYRDVKLEDQRLISNFTMDDLDKTMVYESKEDIHFQIIKGDDFREVVKKNDKVWIYVWASWCKPCIEKFPKIIEIAEKNEDLVVLLVSQNYDLDNLQNHLFNSNYNKVPYILDSTSYGRKTAAKMRNLQEDLCPTCEFSDGFPQNYIYYKGKNLQIYKGGLVEDAELKDLGIRL